MSMPSRSRDRAAVAVGGDDVPRAHRALASPRRGRARHGRRRRRPARARPPRRGCAAVAPSSSARSRRSGSSASWLRNSRRVGLNPSTPSLSVGDVDRELAAGERLHRVDPAASGGTSAGTSRARRPPARPGAGSPSCGAGSGRRAGGSRCPRGARPTATPRRGGRAAARWSARPGCRRRSGRASPRSGRDARPGAHHLTTESRDARYSSAQ